MPRSKKKFSLLFVTIALAIVCLSGASDVNAQQPSGDAGDSCVGVFSGTTYATFNWYDYSTTMSPGSNNFVSNVVNDLYYKGVASTTWNHLSGGSMTFDNRFSRDPNGCDGITTTTGGFYWSFATTSQPDGYYAGTFVTQVGTTTFYWLKEGITVIPVGAPSLGLPGQLITYSTQYNTRFTGLEYQTSTSSVLFDVGYYVDPTEATTTQADRNPTMVVARYGTTGTNFGSLGYSLTVFPPTWGTGTTTVELPNLEPDTQYTVQVTFGNGGSFITGIVPFSLAYVYFELYTDSNGAIATTTPLEFYDATEEQAWATQPCSLTEITGCIINAFAFLFQPSSASLTQFASLKDEMEGRSPFVYVYQLPSLFGSMFSTTQTQALSVGATTSIGYISFISEAQLDAIPLSATVRTIVGYLLWILLAIALYYRVTGIFNHQEKTV